MSTKSRLMLFFLFTVLQNEASFVHSRQEFTLHLRENTEQLKGKIEQAAKVATMSECFTRCLRHCWCSAFDLRQTTTNESNCYLRAFRSEADAFRPSIGYSHFDIEQKQPTEHCDAFKHCRSSINCCLTSDPCFNRGTCTPTGDIRSRYKCACSLPFTGKRCGICALGYSGQNCSSKITSCRGYASGSRTPEIYTIRDDEEKAMKVFCDFDKDSNLTWTMVQSYSLKHRRQIFKNPFWVDSGLNYWGNPLQYWHSYRLPSARMESIQNDSTKWRVTCEFDKSLTAKETDSMRGSKTKLNILTFRGHESCKHVDYINVRGYNCSNCTAVLYQTDSPLYPLHLDSKKQKCNFRALNPKSCDPGGGEDNFGLYNCANPEHRCSATENSTTQTWLGG